MRQVYPFGFSDLQHSGIALLDATYWKLSPLFTLPMSYVFRNTTHPSLQFFMAPRPTQKEVHHSMLIHESG